MDNNEKAVSRSVVKCRHIRDESSGLLSFQMIDGESGKLLVEPDEWYATKPEVLNAWRQALDNLMGNIISNKGRIIARDDERLVFEVDVEEEDINVLVALVGNPQTGQFGIAVIGNGEMLIEPLEWFKDAAGAYVHYAENIDTYRKKMEELGFQNGELMITPAIEQALADARKQKSAATFKLPGTNVPSDFDVTSN